MAEKNQPKSRSSDEARQGPAPTHENNSIGQKIGRAFLDLREQIAKPKDRGGPEKVIPETKKPPGPFLAVFNAQKVDLKSINQTLIIVLVGLILLMVYITLRPNPDISSVVAEISKIKIPEVKSKEIMEFEALSFYLDQIKKRDIFSVYKEEVKQAVKEAKSVDAAPPPPPPEPKVPIAEKAKNIKLLGISWGDNPKAIIRDTSTQSMHFISEGETIKGTELTVKKVYKEQVIIESDSEEMTLQ